MSDVELTSCLLPDRTSALRIFKLIQPIGLHWVGLHWVGLHWVINDRIAQAWRNFSLDVLANRSIRTCDPCFIF